MRDSFIAADPISARDAFHEQRRTYFTASAAACLFGKHPFMSAADYWIEKFNNTQVEETDEMIRGQELEPAIASWFSRQEGLRLRKADRVYTYDHMAATPDYIEDNHGNIVEVKSTAYRDVAEPLEYWVYQVQFQMEVMDIDKAYIVWIDGGLHLCWTEIDRDQALGTKLYDLSRAFMESVDAGIIPDWVETEARHIISMFPDPSDSLEAGDKGWQLVQEYWTLKSEAAKYDDAAAAKRDELFNLVGNHDALTYDGAEIATFRPRKVAGRLNKSLVEQFAAEHGVHINTFMSEPTTTRALNVPKKIKQQIEGATNG